MAKSVKRALQAAHMGSAIILGMAVSGMDYAPTRTIAICVLAFVLLLWSYHKIYEQPGRCESDTPIDEAVRRDLGIKD
jgi:hypothetical protein